MSYNEDRLQQLKDSLAVNLEQARSYRNIANQLRNKHPPSPNAEKQADEFDKRADAVEEYIQHLRKEISIFEQQVKEEKQSDSGGGSGGGGSGSGTSGQSGFKLPTPPLGYGYNDLIHTPNGWAVAYDPKRRRPNIAPVVSPERWAEYQAEYQAGRKQQKDGQNMPLPQIQSKGASEFNPGFTMPPPGIVGGAVLTKWRNTKTGQTYTAPNAAWVPPSSDWVKVEPNIIHDQPPKAPQGPLLPPPIKTPSGEPPPNIPGRPRR